MNQLINSVGFAVINLCYYYSCNVYIYVQAEAGPLSVDTYAKSQPGMIAGALTSLTITIAQGITPMSKTPIPLV